MAKLSLYYFFLLFSLYHTTGTSAAAATTTRDPAQATSFIKDSCRATQYPLLCVQCLSAYASTIQQSEHQIAQAALSVSLARAQSTTAFVSKLTKVAGIKPRVHQAVKDCIDNMVNTVDQLSRSVKELGQMGRSVRGQDFMWHASNVQTWVSAALTGENTCVDGFAGRLMEGSVKDAVKRRVVNTAQVTSVALALVNRFTERHKAVAGEAVLP